MCEHRCMTVCLCTFINCAYCSVNPLRSPVHRRHPLFPLLALLFEKCEQSTQSSDCVSSASFNVDIENFVRSQKKEGKGFFCDDPDVDNLVRNSALPGSCSFGHPTGNIWKCSAMKNKNSCFLLDMSSWSFPILVRFFLLIPNEHDPALTRHCLSLMLRDNITKFHGCCALQQTTLELHHFTSSN